MALTGLAKYLSDRYNEKIGSPLGWTENTYDLIVEDTLEILGIEAEGEAEAIALHKVGILCLWMKVFNDIALDFSFSADGASYSLGDVDVSAQLALASSEAQPYLSDSIQVDWGENRSPYSYDEDRDNAGNF